MARRKKSALRRLVEKAQRGGARSAKRASRIARKAGKRAGRALGRASRIARRTSTRAGRAFGRLNRKLDLSGARWAARQKRRVASAAKRHRQNFKLVRAKKVVIPARPMVPEGDFGTRWTQAFEETAASVVSRLLKR